MKCRGKTKARERCKRKAEGFSLFCKQHKPHFLKIRTVSVVIVLGLLWNTFEFAATISGFYRDVVEPALFQSSPAIAGQANSEDLPLKKNRLTCGTLAAFIGYFVFSIVNVQLEHLAKGSPSDGQLDVLGIAGGLADAP